MNIYQEEKEIQNRVASAYDSVYRNLIVYEDRWDYLCKNIEKFVSKESKILEIGCGTATFLSYMSARGYKNLYGIDLSEEAIKVAISKVPDAKFQVGNMINLPYENESFDMVVFMGSLHHLPYSDISIAINEAQRCLLRGGVMVIADSNKEFDSFKPMFLIKVLRKLISIKNYYLKRKLWKFNPSDSANYTSEHMHKSRTDYINLSMINGSFILKKELLNEHFIVQFEGVLFKKSLFDKILFFLLKKLDSYFPLNPQAQLLQFYEKR